MYIFCCVCIYAPLYMCLYHKVVCSWVSGVLCAIVRPFALSLGMVTGRGIVCLAGPFLPPHNCSSPALLLPRTTPPRTPWPATYPLLITTFPQSTFYTLCPCAPLRRHVCDISSVFDALSHFSNILRHYNLQTLQGLKGLSHNFLGHFEVYFSWK